MDLQNEITAKRYNIELSSKQNFSSKRSPFEQNEEILVLKENPKANVNIKKDKKLVLSGLKNEKRFR